MFALDPPNILPFSAWPVPEEVLQLSCASETQTEASQEVAPIKVRTQ
jgi:hypothetical protein